MKVLLTGGTGFVGAALARALERRGHEPLVVSRRPGAQVTWEDASLRRGVEQADAVVHLAGENLFAKRWTTRQKEVLWRSRHDATRKLAALVAARKPSVFISASAVGFYGASSDATFDERSPRGDGFLAELCADWEAAADAASEAGVRTAIVRFGVVLEQGGGALAKMLPIFKLGFGGPLGNGKQWVSWIHRADAVSLIAFLVESDSARGVFNATAPNPVTMKELSRELGRALHRPAVLPAPAPMLRLALGEVADVLLTGQRVLPRRAQEAGFRFAHPDLAEALQSIVSGETPVLAG